ncbi:CDC50 family protein-like protein [Polyplosphaeria fusca]|uniref:CDC50 family protein-like protein n=1 Tax=Polyplosphaeria fusca TaxID=682080 RepID=A0A9P4V148_9PLEO|nr:CDC50 family protein-like protein [Polyplosphaeria fusca]
MSQTQVEHSDSISSQDPSNQEHGKKTKSRRPANTAFRQQRLKAWQPILTPKTVLPLFFIVGIIFAPIGALLLYASAQVQELSIDYTDCISKAPETKPNFESSERLDFLPSGRVSHTFSGSMNKEPQWGRARDNATFPINNHTTESNICILTFEIPDNIKPPILFYYRLTNFYQNHRRYVRSFDIEQLKGNARSHDQIQSGECDPIKNSPGPNGKPYYPCGLIANSMFNDTFNNLVAVNPQAGGSSTYNFTRKGISWSTEGDLYKESKYNKDEVVPPPNWADLWPKDGYESTGLPNLHEWEEFQVWMRTAGLPTFSKLAMRNNDEELKIGTYRLNIVDRFPVDKYGGTKSILISTRTVMGGRNPFLGIAYVVVGGLCILLGALFTATHLVKPRKLGDHTYLTWNNDQPSTATTTGRSARPGESA